MKLARILYPVYTLGPGRRFVVWMQGCERSCPGCANPELQDRESLGEVSVSVIEGALRQLREQGYPPVEGVTITGGEPFLQAEALNDILNIFLPMTDDVLVYTGFVREELAAYEENILSRIAVLIDGEYLEEQNNGHPLKGSENQRIYYRDEEIQRLYEQYIRQMSGKQMTQTFSLRHGSIAAGIHEKDFRARYESELQRLCREKENKP